ncbi:transcription factor bHLH112-like isoform X2 [Zingiber officinale]|uniref:transcription factor bHLH112-like isoform X2 n=1 Tax=Zingiber officinale TaxID=94328 RepID=UPI001C4D5555|nr:transcription factor bHLH112-like isoform X2 [Zingiber officinale]
MADQFQATAPSCTSTSTSTTWWRTPTTTGFDIACRSDESPASISSSSITFQDIQSSSHVSAPMLLDMDLGLSSDWNQPFFSSSGSSGRAQEHQNSFQALLQEDMISRPSLELNQIQNIGCFASNNLINSGLPSIDYESILQNSEVRLAQFMKASSPSPPKQQLQFSNETPFWNPSASGGISTATNQAHSMILQNQTSSFSNNHFKNNVPGLGAPSSMAKRSGSEPALKKPNLETPSPLPTFKVRKEKLGDRITALQQMVSPFGKTDTASVLHETIEYIKFLHDQVQVLSAPYLKNSHQNQQIESLQKSTEDCEAQNDVDLRSQGLCLVPISSTFPVANDIPTDFWNPTFIGNFR